MRRLCLAMATVGLGLCAGQTLAGTSYTFQAEAGDFNVAANWDPQGVPLYGDPFSINGKTVTVTQPNEWSGARINYTSTVSNGGTLNIASGASLSFNSFVGESLRLNLNGGTLNVNGKIQAHKNTATNSVVNIGTGGDYRPLGLWLENSSATITSGQFIQPRSSPTEDGLRSRSGSSLVQTGGIVRADIYVGGGTANTTSTYHFSGGKVFDDVDPPAHAAGTNLLVGTSSANTRGEMLISNGARWDNGLYGNGSRVVRVGGGLENATGVLTLANGKFYATGLQIGHGGGLGSGEMVIGANAANEVRIGRGWNALTDPETPGGEGGHFMLEDNGTLTWKINSQTVPAVQVGGIVGLYRDGTSSAQNAELRGIINLDLISGYVPLPGTTYELVSVLGEGTITDSAGVRLSPEDAASWTLAISPDNKMLTVSYVPEPAGLAILGLAVPALLRRRRRTMSV